jgi:hypothetical protein
VEELTMNAVDDVRALFGPRDPAAGQVAPPACTAADLIARADRAAGIDWADWGPQPAEARFSRRTMLVAAGLAVGTAGAVVGYPLFAAVRDRAANMPLPDAGLVVVPLAFQVREDPPSAGEQLRALAQQLRDAPSDGRTGRYAYHHTRDWGFVQVRSDGHDMSYVQERWAWITADGSGRARTVQLEPQFADPASERYWRKVLAAWTPDPTKTTDSPGNDAVPARRDQHPAPADRTALADALRLKAGGATTANAVLNLVTQYILPRATRAMLLELLADARGFVWRGEVTDRAGRTGVAVSNDDRRHDVRSVLVFDPQTGELVAFESVQPDASKVVSYWLHLETNWTDQPG